MENITVEIAIPAINRSYDFQIPPTNYVHEVVNDLIDILEQTQQNILFDRRCPMLCDIDRGITLDPNAVFGNTNVRDGSTLMLL